MIIIFQKLVHQQVVQLLHFQLHAIINGVKKFQFKDVELKRTGACNISINQWNKIFLTITNNLNRNDCMLLCTTFASNCMLLYTIENIDSFL